MKYLIIGLGIYGSNLAMDLAEMGHEVIVADINSTRVEQIKDYVSTTYILNSTDEAALNMLPLKNVDLVIVAIGENFGASIRTVALLKKIGVKKIYARAIDKLHESILESFQIDRIITPEQRAAVDLVAEMELGSDVCVMKITDDYYSAKFKAPEILWNVAYSDLDLEHTYGLKLIAVTRAMATKNIVGINRTHMAVFDTGTAGAKVTEGDVMLCTGDIKSFRNLFRAMNG